MLRTVLYTHAAPITPVDRWWALADSFTHRLSGFPRSKGGSASTMAFSGPAQVSLTLQPACLLSLPSGAFVSGLRGGSHPPSLFPGFSAPDSYRGVSTELLGRDFHPLERCTFMAHVESAGGAVLEGRSEPIAQAGFRSSCSPRSSMSPFPPRRSSNWTCGFPASSSRTDFTRRHATAGNSGLRQPPCENVHGRNQTGQSRAAAYAAVSGDSSPAPPRGGPPDGTMGRRYRRRNSAPSP